MSRKIDPAFVKAAESVARQSGQTTTQMKNNRKIMRPVEIKVEMTWEERQAAEEHNRKVKQEQLRLLREAADAGQLPVKDGWRKLPVYKKSNFS